MTEQYPDGDHTSFGSEQGMVHQGVPPTGGFQVPAPKARAWTKPTLVVLLVSLLVVGATALGARALGQRAEQAQADLPLEMLNSFLDAAVAGDPEWQTYSSPRIVEQYGHSSPFRGDAATAQALGLEVGHSIVDVEFSDEDIATAYYVRAVVELQFDYRILDEDHTTTVAQYVWLTRPFFRKDSTTPIVLGDEARVASRNGEWRVSAIGAPPHDDYWFAWPEPFTTSLRTEIRSHGLFSCGDPLELLAEMSTEARATGSASSSCLFREEGKKVITSESVDSRVLGSEFPYITENDPASAPEEITALHPGIDPDDGIRPPFRQFRIPIGESNYVLTIAPAQTPEDTFRQRLISVVESEGQGE